MLPIHHEPRTIKEHPQSTRHHLQRFMRFVSNRISHEKKTQVLISFVVFIIFSVWVFNSYATTPHELKRPDGTLSILSNRARDAQGLLILNEHQIANNAAHHKPKNIKYDQEFMNEVAEEYYDDGNRDEYYGRERKKEPTPMGFADDDDDEAIQNRQPTLVNGEIRDGKYVNDEKGVDLKALKDQGVQYYKNEDEFEGNNDADMPYGDEDDDDENYDDDDEQNDDDDDDDDDDRNDDERNDGQNDDDGDEDDRNDDDRNDDERNGGDRNGDDRNDDDRNDERNGGDRNDDGRNENRGDKANEEEWADYDEFGNVIQKDKN
eukprot:TRINITY_DN8538_c0_g1_i1.p1 TRINITY_DN8538_c0_g1~~TRINITY_DN8538_c0_g1_i1.p1  ORF type:complete len:320 (-),score=104.08 TRINITY_DN8538_c0_g1_i1:759-1718(-)